MKQINLKKLVSDMRARADMFPSNPLHNLARGQEYAREQLRKYQHRVKIDGYVVVVSFTRDSMPELKCREFYHLSLGNDQGKPELIPRNIVQRIRQAFMPNGIQGPSPTGNTIQFIEVCPTGENG